MANLENVNPRVKRLSQFPKRTTIVSPIDQLYHRKRHTGTDPIDALEIFEILQNITDPEHPLTLAQLGVVNLQDIKVCDDLIHPSRSFVQIELSPTITHCSMATLIGLSVRVKLERSLPARFRISVKMKPGTHESQDQVNKQLADKERVAAACENKQLASVLAGMMNG